MCLSECLNFPTMQLTHTNIVPIAYILSKLIMSHENQNVRKVVITHMTDLIKANRDFFHELIVNEELSSMQYLTVVHDSSEVY